MIHLVKYLQKCLTLSRALHSGEEFVFIQYLHLLKINNNVCLYFFFIHFSKRNATKYFHIIHQIIVLLF